METDVNFLQKKTQRGIHPCRSIENYKQLNKIDEGSYGIVFRAEDKETGEIVAIKKIKLGKEKEGFPITSIREINILFNLHHENIVRMKEVVFGSSIDKVFAVMEYCDHELKALSVREKNSPNSVLSLAMVKCLMRQLLAGVEYMHSKWIIHRDLKTSNLLLNKSGILKIADFGLARKYGSPLRHYTKLVVTLWYRAPELLLNCDKYGPAVDMWSVGCIFAEMLLGEPLIQGTDELDQLNKIFRLLGTPTEESWPGWNTLPNYQKITFKQYNVNKLRENFPAYSTRDDLVLTDKGYDLLSKLLTCNPSKRITAAEALRHAWFFENPLPFKPQEMPTFTEINDKERESRKERKKSLDDKQILQRENLLDGGVYDQKKVINAEYKHNIAEETNKEYKAI
jgi:cell division cycle 2-like